MKYSLVCPLVRTRTIGKLEGQTDHWWAHIVSTTVPDERILIEANILKQLSLLLPHNWRLTHCCYVLRPNEFLSHLTYTFWVFHISRDLKLVEKFFWNHFKNLWTERPTLLCSSGWPILNTRICWCYLCINRFLTRCWVAISQLNITSKHKSCQSGRGCCKTRFERLVVRFLIRSMRFKVKGHKCHHLLFKVLFWLSIWHSWLALFLCASTLSPLVWTFTTGSPGTFRLITESEIVDTADTAFFPTFFV